MGTLTNIIKTVFTSKGASDVVGETERIGRAQTRLGQTSASNSRTFAAQSSGLGGLVAAYAGAAATVFALQAAFTALNNAAKSENVIKGTNALAAGVAASGPKILQSIKDITNGQLTMAEAAQNANIALSAGFNTTQIDRLTVAAVKTSKALGRDMTDSLTRLVRGTAKLEPELLDELGIFVRIDAATRKYAKTMGLNVNNLTDFERRQAMLNAALAEADRKFNMIDSSSPSAQQSLEKLMATVVDLSTVLANMLNTVLKPAADFFANDMGNSVVLFGGILLLVFGKAKTMLSGFFSEQMHAATAWADNKITNIERVKASYASLAASEKAYAASVVTRGGLLPKDQATGVVDRTGSFAQKGVKRDISSRLADFRQQFKGEQFSKMSLDQLKAINTQIDEDIKHLNTLGVTLKGVAANDVKAMQTALSTALTSTTTKTKVLTGAITLMRGGLQLVGRVASGLFSAFNWVFAISSILELFGVDVFGTIIGWFQKSEKEADSFRAGLVGAFTAAAGGAAELTEKLTAAGASQEQIDNLGQGIVDTFDSLGSKVEESVGVLNTIKFDFGLPQAQMDLQNYTSEVDRLKNNKVSIIETEGQESYNMQLQQAEDSLARQKSLVTDLDKLSKERASSEGLVFTKLEAATQELSSLKDIDISVLTDEQYQRLIMLEAAIKMMQDIPEGSLTLLGGISRTGGMDAGKLTEALKNNLTEIEDKGKAVGVSLNGILIAYEDGTAYLSSQPQALQDVLTRFGSIQTTVNEVNDSYIAGTASVETMGRQLIGIRDAQKLTSEEANALVKNYMDQGYSISEAVREANNYLQAEQELVNLAEKRYKFLKDIATVQKGVQTAFGKEIKVLDTAQWDGLISLSGKFAKNETEIAANQREMLKSSLDFLRVDEERMTALENRASLTEAEKNELADLNYKSEAYNDTLKAAAGSLLTAKLELEKIVKEQEKALKLAQEQNALQLMQNNIQQQQALSDLASARAQAQIAAEERVLELNRAQLKTQEDRLSLALQQYKSAGTVLENIKDNNTPKTRAIAEEQKASAITASDQLIASFKPSVDTTALEAAAAKLDAYSKEDAARKQAVANYEIEARKLLNLQEQANFDQETAIIFKKIDADIAKNYRDSTILQAQAALDKARLEGQKTVIQAESDVVSAQIQGYMDLAKITDSFGGHIAALSVVLNQFLSGLPAIFGGGGTVDIVTAESVSADITATGNAAKTALKDVTDTRIEGIDQEIAAVEELRRIKTDQLMVEREALWQLKRDTVGIRDEAKADLIVQQETKIAGLTNEIADLGTAADTGKKELSELDKKLLALFDAIKGNIENTIMSLNNLVVYGEGSFSEIAGNFFKTLQQDVFKQTIAEPLAESLTTGIFGALGVGVTQTKGERGLTYEGKSLLVKVVNSEDFIAGNVIGGAAPKDAEGGAVGWMSKLFGKDGTIAGFFSNLFGEGGILSNLLSGFGNFLGSIFKAIFGGIFGGGLATGGIAHMAQGGVAGASALRRDRIPTLLEPGEFVVRKPAAKMIGTPALNSLNATGQIPNTNAAPIINIKNEGTAKDIQTSQPRFDGDKFVIDIILRDLSNNGPIRRSLRGGNI